MVKNKADSDGESPHRKRQKFTKDLVAHEDVTPTEIHSAKDLQKLLAFQQNAGPLVKQQIRSFKTFLDSITYGEENKDRSIRRAALLNYLQSQVRTSDTGEDVLIPDIIKTWHFATQTNVENLFTSIAAVLAHFLKTISSFHEFREVGSDLCRILLHDDQMKLFDRGLSANRSKEHLISPCLKLLTEIVSFDGGSTAKVVYRQRQTTFQRFEVFLTMRSNLRAEGQGSRGGTSLRSNAIKYLLANIRLQSRDAKCYILAQGRWMRSLFQDIAEDSAPVILEILSLLRTDVILDRNIPQSVRRRVFNDWTLGRIATLYNYHRQDKAEGGKMSVQQAAHAFLLFICTSPDHGLLATGHTDSLLGLEASRKEIDSDDDRASSAGQIDRVRKRHPENEITLSSFLQSLRPYASTLQCDLILACFRVVPKLVNDYFSRKSSFSFEPKLTATWIGYSQLLLATVQLPMPESLLYNDANGDMPSSNMLINHILPQPLTKKVMIRCLNQNSNLLAFLAIRILNATFDKFASVLQIFASNVQNKDETISSHWEQTASKLTSQFCQQLPEIRHVIEQFRSCPEDDIMRRESISRLLASYYRAIPQVALEEKFDVSAALTSALRRTRLRNDIREEDGMRSLNLGHLLEIAGRSPSMQWWHKPDTMPLSPFTTLLKLYVDQPQKIPDLQIRNLLKSIMIENAILRLDNSNLSFDVFVLSLRSLTDWQNSDTLCAFLDNCILRLVKRAVHYQDVVAKNRIAAGSDENAISQYNIDLLLVTLAEQWSFFTKDQTVFNCKMATGWVVRYLNLSLLTGADESLLTQIREQLNAVTKDKECREALGKALKQPLDTALHDEVELLRSQKGSPKVTPAVNPLEEGSSHQQESIPPGPVEEDEDHPGLKRWTREDLKDAVTDGAIGDLMICLCSKYENIRKQALTGLRTFMAKLETSGYSEWQQTFVLAGELVETAREIINDKPLPYFAGVLAARLLSVLADPLHVMYDKVNRFLNRGPQWTATKLPSYWVDKIILHPPKDDNGHYEEVEWLLDTLIDGLRTPADMEIYRRCHIFERLLSLSASPAVPELCFENIVALLFRCTYVDGGSTLITRCGLFSWISSHVAVRRVRGSGSKRLKLLASRAYETSDRMRVDEWSNGRYASTLSDIHLAGKR